MIGREFFKRSIVGIVAFGGATFVEPEDANAEPSLPYGQSLKLGWRASQPFGHHEFCEATPSECKRSFKSAPRVHLTKSLWQHILSVDAKINQRITYMYDIDQWGDDEVWSYADRGFGDCEDYALEKRRALMKYIHPSNLLITFVKVPSGEFHVVLTVRTDRGDFFLDNNEPPMSVDESDYKILRIVDPRHEGRWVRVRGKESIEAWSGQAAATNSITSDLK